MAPEDTPQRVDLFAKQFPTIAHRWNDIKSQHDHRALELWAGTLALNFSDQELGILDDHGYLSVADQSILMRIDRMRAGGIIREQMANRRGS